MLKIIKRIMPIICIALFLTACQKPLDAKRQTQADLKTIITAAAKQQDALSTLESVGQTVPDNYLAIQKKYPGQNLLEVSDTQVAKTAAKRAAAFDQLKEQQAVLKPVTKRLLKLAKQDNPELPIELIKDLNQSLKISTLDYTTLATFYDAASNASTDFYTEHTDAEIEHTSLKAPINRLKQYYSSVYQQAEIAKVNINTVTAHAKKVQQHLD